MSRGSILSDEGDEAEVLDFWAVFVEELGGHITTEQEIVHLDNDLFLARLFVSLVLPHDIL
jgi:hypothetical protein